MLCDAHKAKAQVEIYELHISTFFSQDTENFH